MRWRRHIPFVLDHLIWLILLGVFLFFVSQTDKFLTPINITNILSAAAVLGVLVVAQTFVLITGNFDLSQESTLGLAALFGLWLIVPALAPYWGGGILLSPYLSIVVILVMGIGIGYVIGALITYGKMNNFIVTLAFLLILRGLMLAFTQGNATSGLNFPEADVFYFLGHESFPVPWLGNVPIAVPAMLLVFLAGHIILNHRRFGRDLYAIGGNRQAAIASGIDANRRIRQVYMVSGFLAALDGLMLAGRVASIQVNLGDGYIFTIFAAAVIGGVSLQGGRGTMLGALGGVLLLSTIDRGLNLMRVSVFWIQVIQGLIILIAMFIDAQRVRFRAPVESNSATMPISAAKPIEQDPT
ncbi:MAG: ABC transporter permease [Chloroflexi bacterium]|nr:ABC transporter permease [Chloroflexota bacterium]